MIPASGRVQALVKFDYLILDNSPSSRTSIKGRLERTISAAGVRIGLKSGEALVNCIKESEDIEEAASYIEESGLLPDLLLVDENLAGGERGTSLVKQVVEMGYPAEMLLFSQTPQAPQAKGLPEIRYGTLEVAGQGSIDGRMDIMASRLLTKWNEPEYLRGLVLSRAVDVELAIDECITSYMAIMPEKVAEFNRSFLGSDGIETAKKFRLILSILDGMRKKGTKKMPATLQSLTKENANRVFGEVRNNFAHNLLERNNQSRFKVVLKTKGGAIRFSKRDLQDYFLKCSLMRRDLEALDSSLRKGRKASI
ncbi:MAG: hypothetical protein JRN33_03005 [Nitrososphaerota archaeon]|jgi:hypothetical protein|nr:hypothetical protein [Nitrososphaerota archaeon]